MALRLTSHRLAGLFGLLIGFAYRSSRESLSAEGSGR